MSKIEDNTVRNNFKLIGLFYLLLLFISTNETFSQVNKTIVGSWINTETESYNENSKPEIKKINENYLKYTFTDSGKLDITNDYQSNAHYQNYSIKKQVLKLEFNKFLLIEKVDDMNLVLVELENETITPNSIRYHFIKEQAYLDKLPLASEDIIITDQNTVYIESKKLYPQFINTNFPDFHLYIQSYVKNSYSGGELFTYATFNIHPNGKIDNIKILHHVSKSYDAKIIKAIRKSEGMWSLPTLNGEKVTVIKTYDDRDIMPREITNLFDFSPLKFDKYTSEYMQNFRILARNIITKDYLKALENISECDKIINNEPNLFSLKSLCYEKTGNLEMANKNLNLLKKSKLKYLTK